MRAILIATLLATPFGASAADLKTERLWRAKCASCHGEDGKAQTEQGKKMAVADLSTPAWQKKLTDAQIKTAVLDGVNETRDGKKKEMEAYKSKLRPDQVDALVAYVRGLGQ
jgi:mono/diheme cytochrome c family protein